MFHVKAEEFLNLDPNAHGDFFAGLFAPVAFLWLVIGYFQQGSELRENTRALARQAEEAKKAAEQAKIQAEGIKANAGHAAKDTYFRVLSLYERDLNSMLASILTNYGPQFAGEDYVEHLWERSSNGDHYVFFNETLNMDDDTYKLFSARVEVCKTHASLVRRYRRVFEKVLLECSEIDNEAGTLREALEWSPMGEVYAMFCGTTGRWLPEFSMRSPNVVESYRRKRVN